jgi:hypothetical protein
LATNCGHPTADADAAVVVWDRLDRDLADLLGRCKRKGIPVRVLVPGAPDGPDDAPAPEPLRRPSPGLPD